MKEAELSEAIRSLSEAVGMLLKAVEEVARQIKEVVDTLGRACEQEKQTNPLMRIDLSDCKPEWTLVNCKPRDMDYAAPLQIDLAAAMRAKEIQDAVDKGRLAMLAKGARDVSKTTEACAASSPGQALLADSPGGELKSPDNFEAAIVTVPWASNVDDGQEIGDILATETSGLGAAKVELSEAKLEQRIFAAYCKRTVDDLDRRTLGQAEPESPITFREFL